MSSGVILILSPNLDEPEPKQDIRITKSLLGVQEFNWLGPNLDKPEPKQDIRITKSLLGVQGLYWLGPIETGFNPMTTRL